MNETRSQKRHRQSKGGDFRNGCNYAREAPGDKITIAKIAADVGVSEAAIYRHFASKAQILRRSLRLLKKRSSPASIPSTRLINHQC